MAILKMQIFNGEMSSAGTIFKHKMRQMRHYKKGRVLCFTFGCVYLGSQHFDLTHVQFFKFLSKLANKIQIYLFSGKKPRYFSSKKRNFDGLQILSIKIGVKDLKVSKTKLRFWLK